MPESKRQLAAIMFSDIVGYTALMQADEWDGKAKAKHYRKVLLEQATLYHGNILQNYGDGSLTIFNSAVLATECAIAIQTILKNEPVVPLRIGIHLGDIFVDGEDFFGDGINVAARIESMGVEGCILISHHISNQLKNHSSFLLHSLGHFDFKNVEKPIEVFAIANEGLVIPNPNTVTGKFKSHEGIEKSIAVLAFVNMSNDRDQDYFSDGISEEIINTLAQLPNLKVAGRTSSFTFKGTNEDIRSIGKKLGVRTVLEGSVRSAGDRIRITAQLIDVQSGFHLWSEKYDRVLKDVFEVQDDIAKTILEKLQIALDGVPLKAIAREQTQNVEAYQLYLKGRELLYKRGKYLFEAISLFENALQIDPQYALAYAGLADAYTIICYFGLLPPSEAWPKAIDNANKATTFGPLLAETYNCNAEISILHDWQWEKGRTQYLKAIELNPGYEQARAWYALFYLQLAFEKHEEAILHIRSALEINPLSFYSNTVLGLCLGIAGRLEEGLEKATKGAELEPTSYIAQCYRGCLLHWSGEFEKAVETFEIALSLSNRHSYALGFLSVTYWDWGNKDKAVEVYEELCASSQKKYISPIMLGVVAATLGHEDEAITFVNKAYDEHDPILHIASKCFPDSKSLRALSCHRKILEKMGLD